MIATKLKLTRHKSYCEISTRIKLERFPFQSKRLWWRFPLDFSEHLSLSGDLLIPALLSPCMVRGERLVIEAPVSPRLLAAIPKIQARFLEFLKPGHEIDVIAPSLLTPLLPGAGTGCFFSGGVDSFYSVLKNEDLAKGDAERITHLLFIHGFDIKLKRRELFQRVREHIMIVSNGLKKSYLEISTNLKVFADNYIPWEQYYGSHLASCALALSPLFKTIIIPSSYAWHQLQLTGSHPDLDILWSIEQTQFVHDGCEASRIEKIVDWISQSKMALEHLHVCWQNRNVIYNCGVCEKCLRTMIPLYLGTGETKFPSFPVPLDPEAVRHIKLKKDILILARENLKVLETRNSEFDQRLREALRHAIKSYLENTR